MFSASSHNSINIEAGENVGPSLSFQVAQIKSLNLWVKWKPSIFQGQSDRIEQYMTPNINTGTLQVLNKYNLSSIPPKHLPVRSYTSSGSSLLIEHTLRLYILL